MAHHLPTTSTHNPRLTIASHVQHRRLCVGGGRVERVKVNTTPHAPDPAGMERLMHMQRRSMGRLM